MRRLDHPEDWRFEAENRARKRNGQEPLPLPVWPHLEKLYELELAFIRFALENADVFPAATVAAFFSLQLEEAPSVGMQERLIEKGVEMLALARVHVANARGTRNPGEEG